MSLDAPSMSTTVATRGRAHVVDRVDPRSASRAAVQGLIAPQPFWVTVALAVICAVMGYLQPDSFATFDNLFNITRNFSFIGIMALGMTAVIATGGIDLSVGSIMGLVAVVCGLIAAGRLSLVARGVRRSRGGLRRRRDQRAAGRRGRPLAVRRHARHAVRRPLGRGRAFREPHDLQLRPRRPGLQIPRRRHARHRQVGHETLAFSHPLLILDPAHGDLRCRSEDDGLGAPRPGHRRQRAGRIADRRAGQAVKVQAYVVSGLAAAFAGDPQRGLVGFGDQRARHWLTNCWPSRPP